MKNRNAAAAFRRTAISVAIGMCIAGAVHAQSVDGNILGSAKAGSTVTLTTPSGATSTATARSDGTFSFAKVPPGNYKVSADGQTRDVAVAAGVDSRVSLESSVVDKVTVTGSRIQRDTFNSTSPVLVITRDETLMSGFNSTTAALQGTGVTAGGGQINNTFGGFVTDGGPGANTVGLRGLGATRTLVLLNGRRIAPAGTRGSVGSADLNVFPTAVVDRIEVLKDGASSIYGSDAVAGVVNVITRKNIKGVTIEAQYNKPEDGGGEEFRASGTFGYTADKGYFSGSLEVYDRKELAQKDRDWLNCETDYRRTSVNGVVGEWGSADYIDPRTGKPKCYGITGTGNQGVTINTIGTGNIVGVGGAGTVGTTFNRWRPNASITTGLPGYEGVGGGTNNLNARDTYEPRMGNRSLVSPATVSTGFFQGGYDTGVLGNAELYFEALLSRRESEQTGYRQLSLDYARGSPLIPLALRNAPNLQAAPTALTNGQPLQIRGFIGFGNDKGEQQVDYTKFTGGLKGNLPFSDWKYDGVFNYSYSDASYMRQSWLTDRLARSLDVVQNANGTITCRDTSGGCVAAPVLTPAVVGGQLPQDWIDYTFVNDTGYTKYKEYATTLNTNGTLFSMPHGDIRGAIGIEYRKSEINDTPSLDSQTGNLYNLTSATPTRGKDNVWELYGEAEIPFLRGVPGAEELTANISGRYTDYKSYGSDTTYKIGALYSPIKSLSFRAAQGTSYRAPALFEQFVGATTGFLASTGDPCNNYGALDQTSARARNCASEGLPTNFLATSSITSITIGGAEAGLKAETSKNKTYGVIFQPEMPTGWGDASFAVDYYDIKVDNGVDRIGTGNILSLCYAQQNFASQYCRLVTRSPAGTNRQLSVNNSYVNVSTDVVKGYDLTVRYVQNIGPGTFRLNGVFTKYKEQANKLFPDDPLVSFNGSIAHGAPEKTGVFDFSYTWKAWRVRYGLEWIDKMSSYEFFEEDPATSTYQMATPSYYRHNLSAEYKADKWSIIVGVRNLEDETPPPISQGFANRVGNAPLYSGFDYVGRTWFVNAQFTF
ncbi:TonB-dependent receptor [Usitatibacter palustris]|uniref:Vitamin B12 transporter BtuB n=1 Tax=Usitatibacter palustris TaxID=2732487 RepID=A0A6M4H4V9_9PROT|nr:TonB-dependent receptor [Usitatibacter palustris]QJR14312.1 Vitamin B12 transporter BtuB [Usitatibacter palustris]